MDQGIAMIDTIFLALGLLLGFGLVLLFGLFIAKVDREIEKQQTKKANRVLDTMIDTSRTRIAKRLEYDEGRQAEEDWRDRL